MGEMSFPLPQVYAMEPRSVEEVEPLRWDPPVVPEVEEEESVQPPLRPRPLRRNNIHYYIIQMSSGLLGWGI